MANFLPTFAGVALLLCSAATPCLASTLATSPETLPREAGNLDFEAPQLEPSWQIADPSMGFRVERSTQRAFDGSASGSIYFSPPDPGPDQANDGAQDTAAPAGILQQRLDATPYRGQIVRLRARLSVEGPESVSARLVLQARTDEGWPGSFGLAVTGTPKDQEVRWRQDMVVLEVAPEAQHIQFGLLLRGPGRAWIDAVELEALGPASAVYLPPRELTPRGADNLVSFARLAGIVRHFHAGDANAQTDWPALLRHHLPEIEKAADPRALRQVLESIFDPLVPGLIVSVGEREQGGGAPAQEQDQPSANAPVPPARVWLHKGIATGTAVSARHFRSQRVDPQSIDLEAVDTPSATANLHALPQPGAFYTFELGPDIHVSLPLSQHVPATDETSIPAPPVPASVRDRTVRLANVIEAWNWIQHSFPYFDLLPDLDWSKSLRRALQQAALDGSDGGSDGDSEGEFAETLRRMLADLHDGHADVSHLSDYKLARLPVLWRWLEGRLIVTAAVASADASTGETLTVGAVVEKIDGKDVKALSQNALTLASAATAGHRQVRALEQLATCTAGDTVELLVHQGDHRRYLEVPCDTPRYGHSLASSTRPETITELDADLFYLDLDRLDDAALQQAFPRLQRARGLIFDLRGYPARISAALLQHLITEPHELAPTKFPLFTFPDQRAVRWQQQSFTLDPKPPHLDAPCVVLTDGRAISRAETFLAFFADTARCTIVGETSGGTNGEVNSAALAGDFQIFWTGSRVDRRDGSAHFGVGLVPDVKVKPTFEGLLKGRDEVLEAAVSIAGSKP